MSVQDDIDRARVDGCAGPGAPPRARRWAAEVCASGRELVVDPGQPAVPGGAPTTGSKRLGPAGPPVFTRRKRQVACGIGHHSSP
jgi:hypothetical protein